MEKINLIKLNKDRKYMYKGESIKLDMYRVKVKDLKFNPLNTRIHDVIATKYGDAIDEEMLFSNEVQVDIFKTLKETHNDRENKKILKSISNEIINPFVILENGIVLSGNNRLGLIMANLNVEGSPFDDNFEVEVALIEGKLSSKDIISWELSLQYETEGQKQYGEMGVALQIYKQSKSGNNLNELLKITPYDEAGLKLSIEIASLYHEMLLYARIPKKHDLFRKIKVYSILDGLNSQLKKQTISNDEKKLIKDLYFKSILSSNIPVQKMRDFVNGVVGDTSVPKEKRVEFIKEFNAKISDVIEETFKENVKNKFDDNYKYVDYKTNENNVVDIFDEATTEIKNKVNFIKGSKLSSFKAISKKIEKAGKSFQEVLDDSENTIYYFDDIEIEEMKEQLKKHKKVIESLMGELKEL